jgi:Lamin Tail Domain/Bacterial Ig domain/Calx-beta domain/Secretion system C-terminal sorting domain
MKKAIFTFLTMIALIGSSLAQNVIITEINYNNPCSGIDTFEFVELYNKGSVPVQMEGWQFTSGIIYTFPAFTLNAGDYVVVAYDAVKFNTAFGFTPLAWDPASFNGLNNTSENIILVNADSMFMDSVHYADSAPWPSIADGQGPSLVLCDVNADNGDPANWSAATTNSGYVTGGNEILANPGADSNCGATAVPTISFAFPGTQVLENAGNLIVTVSISNGNANPTTVTLSASVASTATSPGDYAASLPTNITFAGGVASESKTVTISLVDDTDIEATETLVLNLGNATNGASIAGNGIFTLGILDNDSPLTGALLITGVFDAQPGGVGAKGVELKALQNIPDLSIYGVGSASNGGGTDGVEITLPAGSLDAGECVYVAADSVLFLAYFGFNPIADGNGMSINGDDAVELFENGQVIDTYGDITWPTGSILDWNYLDGWGYRKDGTGPDGGVFNFNNWTIALGGLNGGTNSNDAPVPFPTCDYSTVAPITAEAIDDDFLVPFGVVSNLNVLQNDILPVTITSIGINSFPIHGTVDINGLVDITYTPNSGYCGPDSFTYEVCDNGGCDIATVNVTVECPATFPVYDIAVVTTVTGGAPDSLGVTCELQGTVYGIDYQGVDTSGTTLPSVQFYIHDGTGGISVFSTQNFGYAVEEGDKVIVRGEIGNFRCLSQISDLDTIIFVSANNALLPPTLTTFLNESFESELVSFTNMELVNPATWGPTMAPQSTGFDAQIRSVFNPTGPTITMRIDNDCAWFNQPAPQGAFHVTGIGGQFVQGGGGGCVSGYQILPRFASDIELLDATQESFLEGKISFYPNPVGDELFIKTDIISIDDVILANALGQVIMQVKNPGNKLDMSQLEPGLYLITFQVEGAVWTSKLVKK